MPRALMCNATYEIAFREYEDPALRPTEVRIRPDFGAEKHGTMLAFYKGYANARGAWDQELKVHTSGGMLWEYPLPLGNMVVGTIIEVGDSLRSSVRI